MRNIFTTVWPEQNCGHLREGGWELGWSWASPAGGSCWRQQTREVRLNQGSVSRDHRVTWGQYTAITLNLAGHYVESPWEDRLGSVPMKLVTENVKLN